MTVSFSFLSSNGLFVYMAEGFIAIIGNIFFKNRATAMFPRNLTQLIQLNPCSLLFTDEEEISSSWKAVDLNNGKVTCGAKQLCSSEGSGAGQQFSPWKEPAFAPGEKATGWG